jgi:hypothetical protein
MQIRPMSVLASSRQRYPLRRYVNVAVRRNPKAQDCVTKTIRDPFTAQFTPMPRGNIACLAASFRHIDACARGEIPIVAAPPPFPTRDFLPWRFSAAGVRGETVIPAAENLHKTSPFDTSKQKGLLSLAFLVFGFGASAQDRKLTFPERAGRRRSDVVLTAPDETLEANNTAPAMGLSTT